MDGWEVPDSSRPGLDRGPLMDVGPKHVRMWLARLLELSPAVLRHAHRQLQRSRRAGEHRVANLLHLGASVLLQRLFNDAIQTAQLTAAAAQHDVIQHPLLEFRVKASN